MYPRYASFVNTQRQISIILSIRSLDTMLNPYRYIFASFLFLSTVFASTVAVQGVLRDPLGRTVDDGYYQISFIIYNDSSSVDSVYRLWSETHGSVEVQHGVFSVELGTIAPMTDLTFIEQYWVGVKVQGGLEMSPRTKLTTSPYSKAVFGTENIFPSVGNVGVGTTEPGALLHIIDNTSNSTQDILKLQNSYQEDQLVIEDDGTLTLPTVGAAIGVGTATPEAVLDINSSGTSDDFISIKDGNGDTKFKVDNDGSLTIPTDGGAIGIGTDDPQAVIHVESSESSQDMFLVKDVYDSIQVLIDADGDMTITNTLVLGDSGRIIFGDGTSLVSADFGGAASSVLSSTGAYINADSDGDGTGDIEFQINGVTKASISNNGDADFGGDASVAGALAVTGAATVGQATSGDNVVSFDDIYPVGSIYMNANDSTNPGELLGVGTWAEIGEGKVLLGESSSYAAETTGGAETHALTEEQMKAHTHTTNLNHGHTGSISIDGVGDHTHGFTRYFHDTSGHESSHDGNGNHTNWNDQTTGGGGGHGHTGSTTINDGGSTSKESSSIGSSSSFNIMQPYLVVYMWYRTA
tara:strand:- start:3208 stop:4947 length:1740 start_codon:yes stop_codon:yes gene_type:complete